MSPRRGRQGRVGRGFTLIEVSLAAVMGAIIFASAIALLMTIRRADEAIQARAQWISGLNNLQRDARRALNNLVFLQNNAGDLAAVPPNFSLARGALGSRLELVLAEPLYPLDGRASAQFSAQGSTIASDTASGSRVVGYADTGSYRGAFELRRNERDLEFVWRPLAPVGLPEGFVYDASTTPPPAVLATGVEDFRWQVYGYREELPVSERFQPWGEWTATTLREVPAYVRLEIRAGEGAYGVYVFAIDWSVAENTVFEDLLNLPFEDEAGDDTDEQDDPTIESIPDEPGLGGGAVGTFERRPEMRSTGGAAGRGDER